TFSKLTKSLRSKVPSKGALNFFQVLVGSSSSSNNNQVGSCAETKR
ncbi:13663_t:CDS:1, partial [Funneliformis caledonium]